MMTTRSTLTDLRTRKRSKTLTLKMTFSWRERMAKMTKVRPLSVFYYYYILKYLKLCLINIKKPL